VARALALPDDAGGFYPRVLGGVLTGIAAALLVERRRVNSGGPVGLGAGGAIAVNGVGGGSVVLWLLSSQARELPVRGRAFSGASPLACWPLARSRHWVKAGNERGNRGSERGPTTARSGRTQRLRLLDPKLSQMSSSSMSPSSR